MYSNRTFFSFILWKSILIFLFLNTENEINKTLFYCDFVNKRIKQERIWRTYSINGKVNGITHVHCMHLKGRNIILRRTFRQKDHQVAGDPDDIYAFACMSVYTQSGTDIHTYINKRKLWRARECTTYTVWKRTIHVYIQSKHSKKRGKEKRERYDPATRTRGTKTVLKAGASSPWQTNKELEE